MSPFLQRNLKFRVAAPTGRVRGALAFLGLRRRTRCLSTTNCKIGGQTIRPRSADGDKISIQRVWRF